MNYFDNMPEFLEKNKSNVYSLQVIKKVFTPYEQNEKFSDEDIYETVFDTCVIDTVINLGNDYLIGFRLTYINTDIIDDEYKSEIIIDSDISYYKLSEILLTDITLQWLNDLKECGLTNE